MELSYREFLTVVHGLILGTLFLLAFSAGLVGLWSLRPGYLQPAGIRERMRRLYIWMWAMAATAWLTVITGTWIVYPWYRQRLAGDDLAGCTGLMHPSAETCSPRDFLLSETTGRTAGWHEFGMEWKEHISWAAPLLATAAAFLITYYGPRLIARPWLRAATLVIFVAAFGAAVVGGAFGAFLNKVAPVV